MTFCCGRRTRREPDAEKQHLPATPEADPISAGEQPETAPAPHQLHRVLTTVEEHPSDVPPSTPTTQKPKCTEENASSSRSGTSGRTSNPSTGAGKTLDVHCAPPAVPRVHRKPAPTTDASLTSAVLSTMSASSPDIYSPFSISPDPCCSAFPSVGDVGCNPGGPENRDACGGDTQPSPGDPSSAGNNRADAGSSSYDPSPAWNDVAPSYDPGTSYGDSSAAYSSNDAGAASSTSY
ncbi:hypothetical protein B0H11DRAFT_2193471 [Mycena galericulata]|nr:hypothetical protein B0H11DRAFT_2193471 [Mycena galericulata]